MTSDLTGAVQMIITAMAQSGVTGDGANARQVMPASLAFAVNTRSDAYRDGSRVPVPYQLDR